MMSPPDWSSDDANARTYFTSLVEQHGVDVKSLDWGSKQSQELRFRILVETFALDGASVLDVGCGLGDLFGYLTERGVRVRYTGVDITPKMVALAATRFPEGQFRATNLLDAESADLEAHDYVFASGIFFCRTQEPERFVREMVTRMFALARRGVAFNSLSAWSPVKDAGEYYADPLATLGMCRELTPWVALRHDYHPRDFTIQLRKAAYGS